MIPSSFLPRRLLAICLLLIASQLPAVFAGESTIAGFSKDRLERIDTWLQGMVDRREAAGFVTYLARRGTVVHHKAFGTRGMDLRQPMPKDAIFDLASMTKPVVAVATMMLVEEGKLLVDDPISDYIPQFTKPKTLTVDGGIVEAKREITVRDLLTHTSGIVDDMNRKETYAFETLKDYVDAVSKKPLKSHPGERYIYGDSYHTLGYLVETVAGMPLDQFIAQRITGPLGMRDTHYWPPASKDSRRALLVVDGKDDPKSESRIPSGSAGIASFMGGGSGLYSTSGDYGIFCQMLLDSGILKGHRYLGPRTIEWMTRDHIGDTPGRRNSPENIGFGFGMAVVINEGERPLIVSEGTYYWGGSQGTIFWIDPKEEIVAVLMVQIRPNQLQLRDKFYMHVYSALVD